ncbi:hypothetical protein BO70DRAFT_379793 [Aspergillus heteromorphus CBS 117.55]|uniref:DUF7730 domain-containing protein n=1 Tax=Aspergillus heteromorphus CBS 117.55 TaxID=1448321 RepID=A0A317W6X6_9EURO|nr:uncharacterized protein BO70DRAFT_379793 [Aspergillus heteromorphus CBS 117.55]PWY81819.1 hypothetical protein BO70DRAFT_379793 [Aspergillus heteromorphus CBS 117.55]
MRHFDAWLLRDPYSIFHYYPTGRRWPETVRELIHTRQICSPGSSLTTNTNTNINSDHDSDSDSDSDNHHDGNNNNEIPPLDPATTSASQPQSPFFARLPPEIRLMIYAYVFDAPTVHLVQIRDRVRHVRCAVARSMPLDQHRLCCPVTTARWRNAAMAGGVKAVATTNTDTNTDTDTNPPNPQNPPSTPPQTLPPHPPSLANNLTTQTPALLTTCRAIYTESLPVLYTLPTFDTDDLHTLLSFLTTISPVARAHIHRLTVQFAPVWQPLAGQEHSVSVYAHTHNDRLWRGVWRVVARLAALEELRLGLDLGCVSLSVGENNNANGNGGLVGAGLLEFARDVPWLKPLLGIPFWLSPIQVPIHVLVSTI